MNTPIPIIKPSQKNAPTPGLTRRQRWGQGRHVAAEFTGYVVWMCLAVFVAVNLYSVGQLLLTGGVPGYGVNPPFTRINGMESNRLLVDEEPSRNLNGDGATYQVWRLTGDKEQLRKTVTNEVWDNLVWFHRPFDKRDRDALEFVSQGEANEKAAPFLDQVKAGDFYFAYEELRIYDDGRVGDAGIWLFSPDKMLLVYLNRNI